VYANNLRQLSHQIFSREVAAIINTSIRMATLENQIKQLQEGTSIRMAILESQIKQLQEGNGFASSKNA
jgi:hypothetical protein